jgi:hypothetical protein
MRRGGRRHKQLLDDLREKRGYWKLNEEALDHLNWKNYIHKMITKLCGASYVVKTKFHITSTDTLKTIYFA